MFVFQIVEPLKMVEQGPLRASVTYRVKIGANSEIRQKISIDAVHPYLLFETTINWDENHKFLKVSFYKIFSISIYIFNGIIKYSFK